MAHLRGAAVDRQAGDAGVLEPAREVDDRHLRLGAPADARLHRDRQLDRGGNPLRHLDHGRGLAQPAGACAAPGDPRHPAAAVDVDEGRSHGGRDLGRLEQQAGIGAVDLDRGGPVVSRRAGCGGARRVEAWTSCSARANSVTQTPAPRRRQRRRKGASVTSSIGASTTGLPASRAANEPIPDWDGVAKP